MKKKLAIILILGSTLLISCGNRQILDTKWTFKKATIVIGNEAIHIDVDSWKDYDDTSIQIKDKNGKVYLTDIKNVLMMSE